MALTKRQKQLIEERNERIRVALLAGESETHVMAVEGADPQTVGAIRRSLIRTKGKLRTGKSPPIPYGLGDGTSRIRSHLGNRVSDLRRKGMERWEISTAIGITPIAGINAATVGPERHDWKMSELERLAKAGDTTFIELILSAAKPTLVGYSAELNKAEKERWNSMIARFLIG